MKTVTVVYDVVDEAEWAKRNPLHYAHDGLKAVRVGIGDALDARDALTELLPFAEEDYYPNCATPDYKAAMEHAKASLSANTYHPDVMKAAQTLIGVAWRKEQDRIPGAVDRVLGELKKHPTQNKSSSFGAAAP